MVLLKEQWAVIVPAIHSYGAWSPDASKCPLVSDRRLEGIQTHSPGSKPGIHQPEGLKNRQPKWPVLHSIAAAA